ncbi:tRNA_anti-like [Pseudomonas aeruginosa]|uniref:OB-fold protein n=1 Tax=Pseudomonas aeruginosa TaxID=287 RepID=UPI000A41ABDE|nr:hypothetical protein [Pseudomonas aeruginosa]SQC96343.1 tRNA_anti-like [Pseudomonas aeruginosa]HBN9704022.1 hypothetical protein [Pseudomonas aeruginosa]HBN9722570.1 hypothetical protein [Pseudomonas aeruginosa]HBN9771389.1 hypothetical protein [Pseudomonas aeruginosa]HBN9893181.1 hypothetical protein [Pseudomonas aeruginosa]
MTHTLTLTLVDACAGVGWRSALLVAFGGQVSAQQLAQAYDRNTVAADQQFKGKRFKVSGVVDSINTDLFGNPYVTLRGGVNQFMQPQFELDKAHANYAAGLQSGMRITMTCRGRGDVAKTPMSDECVPAN